MPVGCVINGSLCDDLSDRESVVRLSQRDIQYLSSADQVHMPGFDLNTVVFSHLGYTMNSLNTIGSYLDLGFFTMFVDVFYDTINQQWQLCPLPFPANARDPQAAYNLTDAAGNTVMCQPSLTFSELALAIASYINLSNTNVAVNLLRLAMRLRTLPVPPQNATNHSWMPGDSSLNQTLTNLLGHVVYSPADLASDRASGTVASFDTLRTDNSDKWPTLELILLYDHRRIIVSAVAEDNFSTTQTDLDPNFVFIGRNTSFAYTSTLPIAAEFPDYHALSNASFLSAGIVEPVFENFADATDIGYSPIVNTSDPVDMVKLIQSHTWGWAESQPAIQTEKDRVTMMQNNQILCCVLQSSVGWLVGDCLRQHPVLCRNSNDPFDWILTSDNHSYFDADCPGNYEFDPPRTALEARAARRATEGVLAWTDINSLSLPNCWITGGVRAACPYNIIQSSRNGVALIVVTATVSVCLLLSMVFLEWDRLRFPLITSPSSRRRRALRQAAAEGVPT